MTRMNLIATTFMSLLFAGCVSLGCGNTDSKEKLGWIYDLRSPNSRNSLPSVLNEISGQTIIDSSLLACIQDENGIVFFYDTEKNKIVKQTRFAPDGDYEGICKVGNDLYILRSDGMLFHLANYASDQMVVTSNATEVPADNNEGLCYDALNNRLLIGCKSKVGKEQEWNDVRVVYGYDLATKKRSDDPVYVFDVAEITAFAEQHDIRLPHSEKKKGNEPIFKFKTSELAIHPLTNELYVLSATDHALLVFDQSGALQHLEMLDQRMFNKAEGISFYPNGDMLITNEAQEHKPTLLRFNFIAPDKVK